MASKHGSSIGTGRSLAYPLWELDTGEACFLRAPNTAASALQDRLAAAW